MGTDRVVSWQDMPVQDAGGKLFWQVLHPSPGDTYENARRSSLVLRLAHGLTSVLFMGQACPEIERTALGLPIDWNADALVAGKCDRYDAMSAEWLDCIRPATVVFSSRPFDRLPVGPRGLVRRVESFPGSRLIDLDAVEETTVEL